MNFIVKASRKIFLLLSMHFFLIECKKLQIIGGQLADIKNIPFQAAYYSGVEFVGSGSLISPLFVLTAAHCVYNYPMDIKVRLGSSNRLSGGILVEVDRFHINPKYNPNNYDFDFALLRLSDTVQFSSNIQPAQLPNINFLPAVRTNCVVSGWGMTQFGDWSNAPPERLLSAQVQISDFQSCVSNYSRVGWPLTDRMICAGTPDGSKDACLGDSGGPLVCNGIYTGIVSFGNGCAMKDFPGIYARISSALPWIRKKALLN